MSSATGIATLVPTGTWAVDPAHSKFAFSVKHMGIATVRGEFTEYEGTLEMPEDLSSAKVHGKVNVASVNTSEEQRDGHLRSPDFFDAEQFPTIAFRSTGLRRSGSDFDVDGEQIKIHLEVEATLQQA